WRCFEAAPLVAPALLWFFSTRSSAIFDLGHASLPWQQAFLGWYDGLLVLAVLVSIGLRGFTIEPSTARVVIGFAVAVAVSFALGGPIPDARAAFDGMV